MAITELRFETHEKNDEWFFECNGLCCELCEFFDKPIKDDADFICFKFFKIIRGKLLYNEY